jgi:hypothetical protein
MYYEGKKDQEKIETILHQMEQAINQMEETSTKRRAF